MSENLPDIKRENIFIKIRRFFSTFNTKEESYKNTEKILIKKTNFFEEQKEKSRQYNYLLELQKKFENEEITESEISYEDIKELKKVYKDQIGILKAKISKIESQL